MTKIIARDTSLRYHGLNCVGCYIAPFHTITDTAREYALQLEPLLSELNGTISKTGRGS
jgi:hypothetical protein